MVAEGDAAEFFPLIVESSALTAGKTASRSETCLRDESRPVTPFAGDELVERVLSLAASPRG